MSFNTVNGNKFNTSVGAANSALSDKDVISTPKESSFEIEEGVNSNESHSDSEQKLAHEVTVENTTNPKIEPQTQVKTVQTTQAVLRGTTTGVSGPAVTTPIDRFNQLKVEQPNSPVTFVESLKNKPFKGAPVSMLTGTLSNAVFFVVSPISEKEVKKFIASPQGAFALSTLVASTVEPIIMAPFYTIRTKIQSPGNESKTVVEIVCETAKGPKAFTQIYRGLGMNIVRNAIYGVPYFTIYREALDYLKEKNGPQSTLQNILTASGVGAVTGSFVCLFSYPADVVSRLQRSNKPGNEFYNKSAYEITKLIVKNEGIFGFYKRGFKTVPMRMFFAGGVSGGAIAVADMIFTKIQSESKTAKSSVVIEEIIDEFPEAEASKALTGRISSGVKAVYNAIADAPTVIEESDYSEASLSKLFTSRIQESISEVINETFEQSNKDIENGAETSTMLTDRIVAIVEELMSAEPLEISQDEKEIDQKIEQNSPF